MTFPSDKKKNTAMLFIILNFRKVYNLTVLCISPGARNQILFVINLTSAAFS